MGETSGRLSEERLNELVTKIRSNSATKDDVEELAKGHINLARHIASVYAERAPHMKEVFIAEALYGLALALSRAPQKLYDDNIIPYVAKYMRKFVFIAATEDRTVTVPYSTIKSREKKGVETVIPNTINSKYDPPARNEGNVSELKEVIISCVRNEFEKEVIKLREIGYKDQEIADILKCGRSSVALARQAVYCRYCEKE